MKTFWRKRGHGLSIIVPFGCSDATDQRVKNWTWLRSYWETQLPGAEIIMGRDAISEKHPSQPFSKSVAVNDAASRAHGDVYAIIDADGYISASSVLFCAEEIRKARVAKHKLWYVPYRQFYRLTEEASQFVLHSSSADPFVFSVPPVSEYVQTTIDANKKNTDCSSYIGHWFGAMIQIVPREAFELVGGWDERFRGWGGEDLAAMRATDILYWWHKTLPIPVFHIWHPMLSVTGTDKWVEWKSRVWRGQTTAGANGLLSGKYYTRDVKKMRDLVNDGHAFGKKLKEVLL